MTTRRTSNGSVTPSSPFITSAPAALPTDVEARPEPSSATANSSATPAPSSEVTTACTPSSVSVPGRPWRLAAATTSSERLSRPARISASTTSVRVADSSCRTVEPFATTSESGDRQARVQVDDVRHDGRADDARRQQHAVGSVEARDESLGERSRLGRVDEQPGKEADRDQGQESDDDALERALTAQITDAEDHHRHRGGDDRADHERQVEQQVERDRATDDLGEISRDRDGLGLQPERQPRGARQLLTDVRCQRLAGDHAELGREVLHQHGHDIGHHDHPDEGVAELANRRSHSSRHCPGRRTRPLR